MKAEVVGASTTLVIRPSASDVVRRFAVDGSVTFTKLLSTLHQQHP